MTDVDVDSPEVPSGDPELSGRTALITGGAGFIGSHLAARLVGNNEVRVFDDYSTGDRDTVTDEAVQIEGDVTDRDSVTRAMDGVDVVFHHAAVVSVEESVTDPERSHRVNVDGTLAVLDAARRTDTRVVLASSAAVYGDPSELPVPIDEPPAPQSPYGADKLAVDGYANAYAETYGLPVVTLRYFNVYGPGQRGPYSGVVESFVSRALAGEPLIVHGDGTQTRDFVHVSDVVRANIAAATTDHTGTAFNVGTGESVSVRDLAELVRSVTDAEVTIDHEPARPGDIAHSRAATERTRDLLGFRAQVGLREGLHDLVTHRTNDPTGPRRAGMLRGSGGRDA